MCEKQQTTGKLYTRHIHLAAHQAKMQPRSQCTAGLWGAIFELLTRQQHWEFLEPLIRYQGKLWSGSQPVQTCPRWTLALLNRKVAASEGSNNKKGSLMTQRHGQGHSAREEAVLRLRGTLSMMFINVWCNQLAGDNCCTAHQLSEAGCIPHTSQVSRAEINSQLQVSRSHICSLEEDIFYYKNSQQLVNWYTRKGHASILQILAGFFLKKVINTLLPLRFPSTVFPATLATMSC